jgi:phenylacetate-CoA ligase
LCSADVSGIEPKLIFSNGATLTEHTRSLARSRFGIEINDIYGAVEFARLAFECNEHSGLHLITDCAVTEFVEDGEPVSPGETGEIIVTRLDNFAMPLIRYKIGDLGIPTDEKCVCGRSWPLIRSVEGRTDDIFILGSGRKLHPLFQNLRVVEVLKKNVYCISEYQIVQEEKNKIILKFVKGEDFDRKIIENIKENFDNSFRKLNEDVIVEVQIVEEITVERSGKKKRFLSLIN